MAMFQMLPEVIRPIKLFGTVTFSEFVVVLKMSNALIPVLVCNVSSVARSHHWSGPRKLFTTVPTRVSLARPRS